MSAAGHQASQPPLRRDRQSAVVAGVCAGLGRRLGIDPLILRVIFIAATAAGGLGIGLYLLGWVAMPAEGERRGAGCASAPCPAGATRGRWRAASGCSRSRCCWCSANGACGSATRSCGRSCSPPRAAR